jgi:hypothetical protein
MFMQYPSTTTSGAIPTLPLEQRNSPIHYRAADGAAGATAYPINYEELYNLKGRLLTLIDATFTDAQQRKAQKDVVWQVLKSWMDDIENRRLDWPQDGNAPA